MCKDKQDRMWRTRPFAGLLLAGVLVLAAALADDGHLPRQHEAYDIIRSAVEWKQLRGTYPRTDELAGLSARSFSLLTHEGANSEDVITVRYEDIDLEYVRRVSMRELRLPKVSDLRRIADAVLEYARLHDERIPEWSSALPEAGAGQAIIESPGVRAATSRPWGYEVAAEAVGALVEDLEPGEPLIVVKASGWPSYIDCKGDLF